MIHFPVGHAATVSSNSRRRIRARDKKRKSIFTPLPSQAEPYPHYLRIYHTRRTPLSCCKKNLNASNLLSIPHRVENVKTPRWDHRLQKVHRTEYKILKHTTVKLVHVSLKGVNAPPQLLFVARLKRRVRFPLPPPSPEGKNIRYRKTCEKGAKESA